MPPAVRGAACPERLPLLLPDRVLADWLLRRRGELEDLLGAPANL
jgi:hypothetical protein